jgi:hypothetical protein
MPYAGFFSNDQWRRGWCRRAKVSEEVAPKWSSFLADEYVGAVVVVSRSVRKEKGWATKM